NYPTRAIGDTTVAKLKTLAKEQKCTLFDGMASPLLTDVLPEKTVNAVRRFHLMMKKYIDLKTQMSASELASALVDELGILRELKEENTMESLGRRENIQELISALQEFNDTHPGAGLEDFLEEVSLVSDVDMAEFGRNAVTLMTLHSAKGLEFPVVFIAGLEEGLFPVSNALMEPKELEEERRLFYVGITRAMKKLHMLYALTRYRFGELGYSVKSRFIDEMDQSLVVASSAAGSASPRRHTNGMARSHTIPKPPARSQRKDDVTRYFSDTMPKYEDESQEVGSTKIGSRVFHESFGKGKVIAIDGRGDNARAVVDFESVGRKHLMLKFANLRSVR
ncbi:MAG: 3'-5' exonuclease, partial [Bacteroidota bacterium]